MTASYKRKAKRPSRRVLRAGRVVVASLRRAALTPPPKNSP